MDLDGRFVPGTVYSDRDIHDNLGTSCHLLLTLIFDIRDSHCDWRMWGSKSLTISTNLNTSPTCWMRSTKGSRI